jgi:hypothetical protein
MQHPLQFEGSHFCAPQRPLVTSQLRPCTEQSMHVDPKRPHADAVVPAWHSSVPVERSQHPLQLSQPGRAHVLFGLQLEKPWAAQSVQVPPN